MAAEQFTPTCSSLKHLLPWISESVCSCGSPAFTRCSQRVVCGHKSPLGDGPIPHPRMDCWQVEFFTGGWTEGLCAMLPVGQTFLFLVTWASPQSISGHGNWFFSELESTSGKEARSQSLSPNLRSDMSLWPYSIH